MQRTARSEQSKPVARAVRKPLPKVYYHGRTRAEDGTHIIELSVNAVRYAYHLTPIQANTTEYLCRRVSALKALAYAKSRARLVLKQ